MYLAKIDLLETRAKSYLINIFEQMRSTVFGKVKCM